MADLFPITVYLSKPQVAALEAEAAKAGQSGVSSRIRWILEQRQRAIETNARGSRAQEPSSALDTSDREIERRCFPIPIPRRAKV